MTFLYHFLNDRSPDNQLSEFTIDKIIFQFENFWSKQYLSVLDDLLAHTSRGEYESEIFCAVQCWKIRYVHILKIDIALNVL